MCSFAIRENIIKSFKQHVGKYAVITITTDSSYFNVSEYSYERMSKQVYINEDFIENYMMSEYISDNYGFTQFYSSSSMLNPVSIEEFGFHFISEEMPFFLMIYSDVSKSTYFKVGERRIAEGRFAENTSECNISEELAKLNRLSVGDSIEISIFRRKYNLEIVGIYKDNSAEISSELDLVCPMLGREKTDGGNLVSTAVSFYGVSRNNILTAAPSSRDIKTFEADLTGFGVADINYGYDVLVCYTYDEKSIFEYIDRIEKTLPEQFVIMDSTGALRSVIHRLEMTENAFTQLLLIASLISVIFCGFIIFFILKDRTYDIGVFRTKGMSRTKTAVLVSCEILIVSLLASAVAFTLYTITFINIAESIYDTQISPQLNILFWTIEAASIEHEFFLPFAPLVMLFSFSVMIIFTAVVSLFAVLFISRHEPMKTMTEH